MRILALCFGLALAGCSNSDAISPDSAGDGGTKSDGGANDGGSSDGGSSEGGGAIGPGDTVSGSRLKARYLTGDDGSKSFVGWYDSVRNENCQFLAAGDGAQRCLPIGNAAGVDTALFSDDGCTQPVALVTTTGCAVPTYAISTTTGSTCGALYHMYPVTNVVASARYLVSTTCTPYPASTFTFYSYGAEIPASSFVQGTESHE